MNPIGVCLRTEGKGHSKWKDCSRESFGRFSRLDRLKSEAVQYLARMNPLCSTCQGWFEECSGAVDFTGAPKPGEDPRRSADRQNGVRSQHWLTLWIKGRADLEIASAPNLVPYDASGVIYVALGVNT